MRGFWLGVLTTLLAGAIGLLVFLGLGLMPVSADAKPGALETWLTGFARNAAIERAAPERESPVAPTPENLAKAAVLYRDNCAGCHGTPDAKENIFAASLYPPAPQFLSAIAREQVPGSDGEVFLVVRDGIRLTAMPTFAHMLKEDELWQLVVFLKHLDDLPPEALRTLSAHEAAGGH
jgi:mono/diheme cytochrome c family protein